MGKSPKHKITQFFTPKELEAETAEGKLKEKYPEIYGLEGKKIKLKHGKLTTPEMEIEKVASGYDSELGKVLYLYTTQGRKVPLRLPTRIETHQNVITLIYESKAFEDKEIMFKVTRSDKVLKDDSKLEIILS